MTAKPLIALSGLFYPVAILRYFENALRRRDDIDVVTIGPDFGNWLPWKGGMHLPYEVRPVDIPLSTAGPTCPSVPFGFVERKLPSYPDLWIQVDAGFFLAGRPSSCKTVVIATDPHCLNYDRQRNLADIFYCMQTPYMKGGDRYFPYAYDPVWHASLNEHPKELLYDAALAGLMYDQRQNWAQALRQRGYRVFLDTGPSYQDARDLYAASLTGFNWSSKQDTVARVYELMAMGVPLVTNRTPDLINLFEEEVHYLGFNTLDEAIAQSLRLIRDSTLRDNLQYAAAKAVRQHTYDARIEGVLKDVGLL